MVGLVQKQLFFDRNVKDVDIGRSNPNFGFLAKTADSQPSCPSVKFGHMVKMTNVQPKRAGQFEIKKNHFIFLNRTAIRLA